MLIGVHNNVRVSLNSERHREQVIEDYSAIVADEKRNPATRDLAQHIVWAAMNAKPCDTTQPA